MLTIFVEIIKLVGELLGGLLEFLGCVCGYALELENKVG
ncbi:hypothetical protein VCHA38O209_20293 [Vibrio chagasii]|nr:hypothetical protein VCHA52P454_110107 [Vibrio chagasii]CAH7428273.1 hypothetical protein VCHA38O209_20293 [Vibrio chagasii]